jgi:hypothetical protein
MRALWLCALLAVGSCYSPNAQSGAYLCGADDACPDGLSCECGQCVKNVSQAACSFEIDSPAATVNKKGSASLSVEEHEQFPITVQAFAKDGTPATGFAGTIKLSSTWGDVCVGTNGCVGLPDQISFQGGSASATVQLNRETIPPQSALLRAELAGNVGTSGKLRITVTAPQFVRDPGPAVAPLTILPPTSFGFATLAMGAPSVAKTADGWRMSFTGALTKHVGTKDEVHSAIGIATSSDGKSFTPPGAPIYESDANVMTAVGAASVYDDGDLLHVYVGRQQAFVDVTKMTPFAYATIAELTGQSTTGPFALTANPAVTTLGMSPDCAFCAAVDVPMVIRDPNPALSGGGPKAAVMFFSALQMASAASPTPTVSVVRASSGDGVLWDVDPAPILQTTRDEGVIYSPRVVVDGTIYKLFYSTTPAADITMPSTLDPCLVPWHVGYATSSDGNFWVRSPANAPMATHVFEVNRTAMQWDTDESILVGSVVPQDGVDPSSGLVLYYSPFSRIAGVVCSPNGVGRAVRR